MIIYYRVIMSLRKETFMKLKEGVIINEMDGQVMAVDAGNGTSRFNGLIRMNQSAGFVAGLLKRETTLDAIVDEMTKKYDVTADVARENARKVIEAFESAGLLE